MNVREELEKNSDPSYLEFNSKIVPTSYNMYGVRMPTIRDLAKKICKEDWRAFLKEDWNSQEECMIRALVIANAKMDTNERLEHTRAYIPEIDNWALCDIFCGDWKVKKTERGQLWELCIELINTNREFEMRVSVIMMLAHFLDIEYIDDVLAILEKYDHEGYYYRMGAAWTLSYCFIKFPAKTESVLFSEKLNKDTRNKAVQKISDSYRVDKGEKQRLKTKKASMYS